MSEHIIETEMFGDTAFVTIPPKEPKEEIVRCRDCKHFTPEGAIRFSDNSTNAAFCSYIRSYMLQIGPEGFCAWGERK